MLREIPFKIERTIIGARHDLALLDDADDPCEEFVHSVIRSLAVDIEIEAGGVKLHMAAWLDPEHWESDWTAKGIDDPRAFIAGLVVPYDRPLLRDRETSS